MPNMSSRNAHCAWPYPLPNAVTRNMLHPPRLRPFPAPARPRGRAARATARTHWDALHRETIDRLCPYLDSRARAARSGWPPRRRPRLYAVHMARSPCGWCVWAGGRGISMWHVGGPPRRAAGRARGARAPTCCLRVAAGRPAPTPRAATHASRGPPARGLESRRRASRRARPLLRGVVGLGSQRSLY